MVLTYLDSSALLRLCLGQGDVTLAERALQMSPVTSVLAAVELPVAIHATMHRGSIDLDVRDRLLELANQILAPAALIGLTGAIRSEATAVARAFLIRSLDAIHVGTAVVVDRQQRRASNELRFCTADVRQGQLAASLLGDARVDILAPI